MSNRAEKENRLEFMRSEVRRFGVALAAAYSFGNLMDILTSERDLEWYVKEVKRLEQELEEEE